MNLRCRSDQRVETRRTLLGLPSRAKGRWTFWRSARLCIALIPGSSRFARYVSHHLTVLLTGKCVRRRRLFTVQASKVDIHVSGGEFNCAANLADCFELKTGVASAMVRYPIGDLIHERVKAMGVKPFYKYFDHDGVTGPNMATVFSDQGKGVRAPVVFYNRCNEAAGLLKKGDIDWKPIFADGVRWFHSGGTHARSHARSHARTNARTGNGVCSPMQGSFPRCPVGTRPR